MVGRFRKNKQPPKKKIGFIVYLLAPRLDIFIFSFLHFNEVLAKTLYPSVYKERAHFGLR